MSEPADDMTPGERFLRACYERHLDNASFYKSEGGTNRQENEKVLAYGKQMLDQHLDKAAEVLDLFASEYPDSPPLDAEPPEPEPDQEPEAEPEVKALVTDEATREALGELATWLKQLGTLSPKADTLAIVRAAEAGEMLERVLSGDVVTRDRSTVETVAKSLREANTKTQQEQAAARARIAQGVVHK